MRQGSARELRDGGASGARGGGDTSARDGGRRKQGRRPERDLLGGAGGTNRILGGSRACAGLFCGERGFTVGSSSDPAVMSLITAGSCYEPAVMHLITVGSNSRYGHQLWNLR